MSTPNQHNLDRTESACAWFDMQEDRYWEEEDWREIDRDDLIDDGRSDGCGESYAERNV